MSNWVINEYGEIGQSGMEKNATIIDTFFTQYGWSKNAIAAILGNMQPESGINPARWENDDVGNLSGGFGLVQWTPATKLIQWLEEQFALGLLPDADFHNGDNQLFRIIYELENGLQYSPTPGFKETFDEWSTSDKNPGYLAAAFMKNYERPLKQGWGVQIQRAKNARQWYIFLTGTDPGGWLPPGLIAVLKKSKERSCLI